MPGPRSQSEVWQSIIEDADTRQQQGGTEHMAASVKVRVLKAGAYNGPDHKGLGNCRRGQIITTASGWYADWLIAEGLVTEQLKPTPRRRKKVAPKATEGKP